MTPEQWSLILSAVDNCIRFTAFQPELMFDVMPMAEPLAALQIEWYLKGVTIYHD